MSLRTMVYLHSAYRRVCRRRVCKFAWHAEEHAVERMASKLPKSKFQFIVLNSTAYNFIKLLNERLTRLQEYKVITKS